MKSNIIGRGAEAILIQKGEFLVKDRIKKSYRLSSLDEKLRKQRTKKEAKLLEKAAELICVPRVLGTDEKEKIEMEFIEGKKLSEWLDKLENAEEICLQIGRNAAKLHDSNIIHGDLTTSNMILKGDKVFFIDFGLGFNSERIEDKAVDLHLLRQALEAKHFNNWEKLFEAVLKGYDSKDKENILEQLKKVEARGRYKKGF
jgi:TP53 regulating kinase-like protein